MGFWFTFFLFVGFTVVGELLRPRLPNSSTAPSSLGDFTLPTAEEGRCIPVPFGTCKVAGGNVVWYGDLRVEAIQQWVKTSLFGGQHVTVGHKYYLGVHLALCCGPVDDVVAVLFDNKDPGFSRAEHGTYATLGVNNTGLFGGESAEGGVYGLMNFYYGGDSQVADPYLTNLLGALPGYRGVCQLVVRQMYLGTSPYIKPIAVVVRRCPNGLGLTSGAENIGGDANPAAMLYDILTNATWGLGLSSGALDVESFRAAGVTLKAEGLGLSMLVDNATTGWDLCEDILRHVDGVLYSDPFTGLLTLQLARADYVVGDLPTFDESNVSSVSLSRGDWTETRNYVRVRYTDRAKGYTERIAYDCDLANVQIRSGVTAMVDVDYRGIATAANAQKLAARDLKTFSYPLGRYRLEMDRSAWAIHPGSVFRLTWPALGLTNVVLRATRVGTGDLDTPRIRVEAVEDIFAVTWTGLNPPGDSGWTDPLTAVGAVVQQRMEEVPYALLTGRRVATMAAHGTGVAMGYQIWSDPAGGTSYALTGDTTSFTPTALVTAAVGIEDTSFTLDNGIDLTALASCSTADLALGKNLLILDDEVVAWRTVTDNGDGTYTLSNCVRGCCDTAPRAHADNARVWFLTNGAGVTSGTDYPEDLTLTAKLLPYNSLGTLPLASATGMSKTTASRASRPYCPTHLHVNGNHYPASATNPVTVSWSHRNRLAAWNYANAGATSSIETGCQYRVKWYEGASLVRNVVTATTSDTYSPTAGAVAVEVWGEVISGGLTSKTCLLWTGTVS